jgi:hypothetical protein
MRSVLKSTALILALMSGSAAASDAEDAVEFMLTGDQGWAAVGISDVIALQDCKTSYTRSAPQMGKLKVAYYWNKAIWNSVQYRIDPTKGTGRFVVNCRGTCKSIQDGKGPAALLTNIDFLLMTSQERFEKALGVLMSECPGVSSKF